MKVGDTITLANGSGRCRVVAIAITGKRCPDCKSWGCRLLHVELPFNGARFLTRQCCWKVAK